MPNVARCATAARARHAMLLRMPAVIVLATGGTAAAACTLLETCGAQVPGVEVLVELEALDGRRALAGRAVRSLLTV